MSGTCGSIRHALELSSTVQPRAAASGASIVDTSPPAEKSAMSTPAKASGVASSTVIVRPAALTVEPADLPDASNRSSPTGNCRSARTWIIVRPTTPVAPTTATVNGWLFVDMAPQMYGMRTARVYQRILAARLLHRPRSRACLCADHPAHADPAARRRPTPSISRTGRVATPNPTMAHRTHRSAGESTRLLPSNSVDRGSSTTQWPPHGRCAAYALG